jgi:hypothetical protein
MYRRIASAAVPATMAFHMAPSKHPTVSTYKSKGTAEQVKVLLDDNTARQDYGFVIFT